MYMAQITVFSSVCSHLLPATLGHSSRPWYALDLLWGWKHSWSTPNASFPEVFPWEGECLWPRDIFRFPVVFWSSGPVSQNEITLLLVANNERNDGSMVRLPSDVMQTWTCVPHFQMSTGVSFPRCLFLVLFYSFPDTSIYNDIKGTASIGDHCLFSRSTSKEVH